MEAEALRVSKDGQLARHRGAFFLSTTLVHELIEIDCTNAIEPAFYSARLASSSRKRNDVSSASFPSRAST